MRAGTRTRMARHDFVPDDQVPRDWLGRQYCAWCHRPGRYGDRNHPRGALPPTPRAARELDARMLGEAHDG